MSDIQHVPAGFISPYREYSRHNTQTLSGVSHLWQDFFAQALADQLGDRVPAAGDYTPVAIDSSVEPAGGSELLSEIVSQRACNIVDTEIRPPEPLFLPIAEFEMQLLDPPAPPFPADEIVAQQAQQDFDHEWLRPLVLTAGQPLPPPGPAPQPRALFLPIAEFELQLLPPPAPPYPPEEQVEQQKQLDFDTRWARPIVLHNLRIAA
ncbi:energy transducer TonB [Pseudomonas sp. P5_152]|uniref:energy transducer TonB n=1 Tax=unclassified Pseudomonas TaxID=196821 RepID=UPI00131F9024|nr:MULTISPECIES: energy transducer TonB [unclassified Pseudomonas]MDX9667106.1 energy transducer TonB [Pseudomonas sp. P5_152]QHC99821.1 energy transducer TonB [Pseudomonas sp. S04]QHF32305.1 energy transducer TonB [Pseudomonas sp. S19]